MGCRLLVRDGRREKIFELRGDPVLVGRGSECQISLNDPKCSRRQCEIVRTDEGYKVVDLESRNGTRVNDEVVNSKLLVHGDLIRIGEVALVFDDPSRDPGRRIPGRLSDYGAERDVPAPAAPPAMILQSGPTEPAPKPQPLPSLRRTTQRVHGDVHERQTEGVPVSRGQALEVRRVQEEQGILRTVVVSVAVFFGLFALLFVVSSLGGKSPERRSAESTYNQAMENYRQAQNASDPAAASRHAEDALRSLRSVPPEAGSVFTNAQLKAAEIRDFLERQKALARRPELEAREALATRAGQARSAREVEAALEEVGQFRQSYPNALPETVKTVEQIEASLKSRRGATGQWDFEEAEGTVDRLLKLNRYAEALSAGDKALGDFKGDFELHQKAVQLRERVLTAAGVFVRQRLSRAKEYRDVGDQEAARSIYEEILLALGSGRVPLFQPYEEQVRKERSRP